MEGKDLKLCPIGIQTFEKIIQEDFLYVDKTHLVYELANSGSQYVFLSRPRRFGKSLLASTLHSYFAGKKHLFKGLAIEKMETEWIQHPVLHFDMSGGKHMTEAQLNEYLSDRLSSYEKQYGIIPTSQQCNLRLKNLIVSAFEHTQQKVVVIIDEYDAPMLDVVHEDQNLPQLRNIMRNFYSPLKECDPYLRFVFLTGITKFSQMSIFSELNNLVNVSMDEKYAAICGITKEELTTQLSDYIQAFATEKGITPSEMMKELTFRYDGYHFTWPSPDIYNPFSLLNALGRKKLDNFWFGSGTPSYLIEMMRKFDVSPSQLDNIELQANKFDVPAEHLASINPLLYQSGYITIKNYDEISELYTLGIPNNEVRTGLMDSLLPCYVGDKADEANTTIGKMQKLIFLGEIDEALKLLQTFLLTLPYCHNTNYEGHYQQMLYAIFSLFGLKLDVEVRTATGRVDMVIHAPKVMYLIEIKLNQSAESAMQQININQYHQRFALLNLPIVKVGVNFSTASHTITDWIIEETR